jgi:hypothetical protein
MLRYSYNHEAGATESGGLIFVPQNLAASRRGMGEVAQLPPENMHDSKNLAAGTPSAHRLERHRVDEHQRENINRTKHLPAGLMSQHLYPRLAVGDPGPNGEITIRLILGLPCCGVDLDLECPPSMTIEELGVVERAFFQLHQTIAALQTFSQCQVLPRISALADVRGLSAISGQT